jgi:hypothetical protein
MRKSLVLQGGDPTVRTDSAIECCLFDCTFACSPYYPMRHDGYTMATGTMNGVWRPSISMAFYTWKALSPGLRGNNTTLDAQCMAQICALNYFDSGVYTYRSA